MKSFQSLFPPLSPQSLSLSSARRVILVQYDPERDTVDVRHYLIAIKPYGISQRVRKLLEGSKSHKSRTSFKSPTGFLNLGREKDLADFVLRRKASLGRTTKDTNLLHLLHRAPQAMMMPMPSH